MAVASSQDGPSKDTKQYEALVASNPLTVPTALSTACNFDDRHLTATQRAMAILEILERILSFLPQRSLRQVASLVCKHWLTLCQSLFVRSYRWTDTPTLTLVSVPNTLPAATDRERRRRRSRGWSLRRSSASSSVSRSVNTIPDPNQLRKMLEGLTTLYCKLAPRTPHLISYLEHGETAAAITEVATTTMETLQNRARMDLLSNIQQMTVAKGLSLLELHIESLDDLEGFLWPILRSTTMLTSLRLKKVWVPRLPIGRVLKQCRLLEELIVECDVYSSKPRLIITLFPEPPNDDLDQHHGLSPVSPLNTQSGQLQENSLPERIRLKRLQLRDVLFQEPTLRAILDSAPDLYELMIQTPSILQPLPTHLIPMEPGGTTSGTADEHSTESWVSCDNVELFQDVGLQYPQLTSLHFARTHHRYTETQVRTILASFPRASRWSLVWRDLPDAILRDLNSCVSPHVEGSPMIYSNHLTSLEIVHSADWTPRWGNALHEFLCSSPLLEHLKAGSIAYYVENLDLNGLLPEQVDHVTLSDDTEGGGVDLTDEEVHDPTRYVRHARLNADATRKVWACRNLKTLHLEFTRRRHLQHYNALRSSYSSPASSSSSPSKSSGSSIVVLENSPMLSRIVYGYIARFCPHLQDLLIRGYRLNMTLQGGFCLLTRLRELKKVAISQYDCQFKERDILPWVIKRRSSITAAQRLQWKTIYAGWWRLIRAKDLRKPLNTKVSVDAVGVDGIERLGELVDVVDVLKEIGKPIESSPALNEECQENIWANQMDHIWPSLECIRIVFGNKIKLRTKDALLRSLLQKYRPEAELQWISWLDQYSS
ncbi:MAG: hypothetical protein J3Q66DRAFT_347592 [Benniella sp.]|nr:MAG: hypothetical protein J3Q66DRAFT_347592 [Benniella sp.]